SESTTETVRTNPSDDEKHEELDVRKKITQRHEASANAILNASTLSPSNPTATDRLIRVYLVAAGFMPALRVRPRVLVTTPQAVTPDREKTARSASGHVFL